jgi:DNA-binding response OmpR family regulator
MSQKRILLIEDEQDMAVMVSIRLESAGYYVRLVKDGREGFDIAKRDMPDLILLDIMLPSMNGYDICSALKVDKRCKKIPIIILTARAQKEDIERGFKSGADAYIVKPFDPEYLLARIGELIS